jgi:xanthine dehydrogenase small subunit
MRDYLIVYVNGNRHELRGAQSFRSLADVLRYDLRLVGTKVVCAEGDCGSCTVFVGRRDPHDASRLHYQTLCSCIHFPYQLDCTHVVTVEGLKYDGKLNPVQEAMVACQGSQCGFCTPGFIVSMCAMFENEKRSRATPEDVRRTCIGNLCRCTGYEPILRAGASVAPESMRPLNDLYLPGAMLEDFRARAGDGVMICEAGKRLLVAPSVTDAVKFRADNSDCTIVAGATDVGVQINKFVREPSTIVSIASLMELRGVEVIDGSIVAGALASIADVEHVCQEALPEYARLLYWFGSQPIRNAGTIGGNIANGSPIGDSMPAMYVLDGQVELTGLNGTRRVNINDFYTGYKKTVMVPDEIITRVIIPLPSSCDVFKLYKVSRRKDLDISAFTAAIWMRRNGGETIDDVRIAYGGVGPNIIRLRKTEDYFRGNALTVETVRQAAAIARQEIAPISDVRGSADYRAQLGENVLRKFYAELSNGG